MKRWFCSTGLKKKNLHRVRRSKVMTPHEHQQEREEITQVKAKLLHSEDEL